MLKFSLGFCILFCMLSCGNKSTINESDKTQIRKDVQLTLEHYFDDIRKHGLTAEFNYLDHSTDFFWVPPGFDGPISYDSVAAILNQSASNFKTIDNYFEALHIVPLSKEFATYTGRITNNCTRFSGEVITMYLLETGVMIKREDGWKLLNGQTNFLR